MTTSSNDPHSATAPLPSAANTACGGPHLAAQAQHQHYSSALAAPYLCWPGYRFSPRPGTPLNAVRISHYKNMTAPHLARHQAQVVLGGIQQILHPTVLH